MTVLLAIYAYILLHQPLMVTLGLAVFSSVIEMVMYRRGEGRRIKGIIPISLWALSARVGHLIKGWLWMAVFLQLIGWSVTVAILMTPVIFVLNTAFTVFVNMVLARVKKKPLILRLLSILFAVCAIALEVRWEPVLIFPMFQDQIDWLIVHGSNVALRAVGLVLAVRLVLSYVLFLMPREVNSLVAGAAELKQNAEQLPARGWLGTSMLTFQKFLFEALTANFFAGGVFLENSMSVLLAEIRKIHLRLFGVRFRLARLLSR